MAVLTEGDKGDFKNKQFAETEVADKVVEQCEYLRWSKARVTNFE